MLTRRQFAETIGATAVVDGGCVRALAQTRRMTAAGRKNTPKYVDFTGKV
jgi:hypothetical protein